MDSPMLPPPALSSNLPLSTEPTLRLVEATPEEKIQTWSLNGQSWRGALSLPTYLDRERHLAAQSLTRHGGITYWALTNPPSPQDNARVVLSTCEALRKRALVATKHREVEEVISYGIGSVFCRNEYRGRGYARRMMKELGKRLEGWGQGKGEKTKFTVLYSDIGKEFYAKNGWEPFPSSHISLPPLPSAHTSSKSAQPLSKAAPIYASDLQELCDIDQRLLRKRIVDFSSSTGKTRVALIPDVDTMQWHHAREEFAAKHMCGRTPEVKGARAGVEGKSVFCIWTRTYGSEEGGNVLHILRLFIEEETEFTHVKCANEVLASWGGEGSEVREAVLATAAVLQAAQFEAAQWGMQGVEIWNPTPIAVLAAKELLPSVEIVHREEESIASLMWYGGQNEVGEDIEWIGNEKYGWC